MKIQIPPSEYPIFKIEVIGPDFLRMIEASTELKEVECDSEGIDERTLTLTGQYCDDRHNPVGDEIVLKVADDPRYDEEAEDLVDVDLDDEDLDGENLDALDDPEDEDDEEAPVEDREEAPVEEADDLVDEPLDE